MFRSLFLFFASLVLFGFSIRVLTLIELEDEAAEFIIANAGIQMDGEDDLLRLQQLTDAIGAFSEPRREFADKNGRIKGKTYFLQSPIIASLAYGGGACGYATELGVRVMELYGLHPRFVQVLNEKGFTHHVVMDVSLEDGRNIMIDPIFGYLFVDSSGQPLDAARLCAEWPIIQGSLPQNKIRTYSYENGIRYTNWEKNMVTVTMRSCFRLVGINHDEICLRLYYNAIRRWSPVLGLIISILYILAFAFKTNAPNE